MLERAKARLSFGHSMIVVIVYIYRVGPIARERQDPITSGELPPQPRRKLDLVLARDNQVAFI